MPTPETARPIGMFKPEFVASTERRFARDAGYQADLAYCRRTIPDTVTFEDWLRRHSR